MASDDPDFKVSSSRPGRVPPTLDLKAEDQTAADVAKSEAGESDGKPEAAESDAAKPEAGGAGTEAVSPAPDAPSGEGADAAAVEAGTKPGSSSQDVLPEAAAPPPDAPAPAAAKPRRAGLIFAALLVGALAGAAAGAGTVYFLAQQALARVSDTIAPLRARLATLEGRPVFNPETVQALSQRVDGVRTALAEAQSSLAALRPLLDRPAPEPQPAPVPPPPEKAEPDPAMLQSLDTLKSGATAARAALSAAQSQIGELRETVAQVRTVQEQVRTAQDQFRTSQEQLQTGQEAVRTALAALGVTVAQTKDFGPRLDALKGQVEAAAAASTTVERASAAVVVLSSLKEALVTGRSFAAELTAARAVLGSRGAALDPLVAVAAAGYPTTAELAARLEREGAAALAEFVTPAVPEAPEAPAEDAGIVNRLLSSAQNLVKVRPAPGTVPAQYRGALGGAVAAVRAGDFAGAVTLIAALPDPVKAKLKAVTADIAARRDAVASVSKLYEQSLAAISGKMP